MECAPVRAQAWLDAHEGDLGGLRVADIAALIARSGLDARVLPYAAADPREEQRGDRVTLRLTATGELASVDAG